MLHRDTKAKISIAWHFFMVGAISGNWASVIPVAKDEHGFSDATLGGVLIVCLAGSMAALPLMPCATRQWGSAALVLTGAALSLLAYPLIGAQSMALFAAAVFSLGFGLGVADVAMNTQAVLCEAATGLPTTGLFHGMYAVGSVMGALVGGALLEDGMSVFAETMSFSVVFLAPQCTFYSWLYFQEEEVTLFENARKGDEQTEEQGDDSIELSLYKQTISSQSYQVIDLEANMHEDRDDGPGQAIPSDLPLCAPNAELHGEDEEQAKANMQVHHDQKDDDERKQDQDQPLTKEERMTLVHIASLSFLGYLGYGSIVDWSTVYLSEDIGCDSLRSTLGFVGFSVCIAAGTFSSDWLAVHIGRRKLLQFAGVTAAAGLVIAVLAKSVSDKDLALSCAIVGFSVCGMGISMVSPSVISLAGSCFRGASSSEAITFVSSAGYVGMMAGPPLLGGMSAVLGDLRWSLAMDAVLMLSISLLASCLRFISLSDRNSLNSGAT